jgi:hypothetical protein
LLGGLSLVVGALVAISATVPIGLALPHTVKAVSEGKPRAWEILIAELVALVAIAAPTSLRELAGLGRKVLPVKSK